MNEWTRKGLHPDSIRDSKISDLQVHKKANKTKCMEFIWKDECPSSSSDLNPLDIITYGMQRSRCRLPMLHTKAGVEERCASDLDSS